MPKKPSFLKRDLDARALSDAYRLAFHLPATEKLDGRTEATLWTPYNKKAVWGKMFFSQSYLCFESKVRILCQSQFYRATIIYHLYYYYDLYFLSIKKF